MTGGGLDGPPSNVVHVTSVGTVDVDDGLLLGQVLLTGLELLGLGVLTSAGRPVELLLGGVHVVLLTGLKDAPTKFKRSDKLRNVEGDFCKVTAFVISFVLLYGRKCSEPLSENEHIVVKLGNCTVQNIEHFLG